MINPTLTKEEKGLRVLAVIYSLSGGSVNVPVHKSAVFAECRRLKIFDMTKDEFEAFRVKTVADCHVLDAETVDG